MSILKTAPRGRQITGILTGRGEDSVLRFHYLGRKKTYAYVFDTDLTMQCA